MAAQESSHEGLPHESVIVVAIDLRKGCGAIMHRALSYASHAGAEVHLVHIAEPNIANVRPPADMEAPDLTGTDHHKLNEFVTRHRATFEATTGRSAPSVSVHTETGDPADKLVAAAAELDADLIILGTHARSGLKRIFLGSVAEKVVRHAGCPVFVVRDKHHSGDSD
jgi:nucleotide-binding universal stress UspA family protein